MVDEELQRTAYNQFFDGLLLLQPQAREKAEKDGFEISIAKTSFKANTKALAENEGEGLAKVLLTLLIISFHHFHEEMNSASFRYGSDLRLLLPSLLHDMTSKKLHTIAI